MAGHTPLRPARIARLRRRTAIARLRGRACTIALLWFAAWPVRAEDMPTFELIAKDGRFHPDTIEVPAGQRFRLRVTNRNAGPEEFESTELRKELVLAPGATRSVVVAPLKPGVYPFFGEFHPDTARGRIIAK